MTKVISLGGSVIVPDQVDTSFLKEFKKLILCHKEQFIIVCGGGKTCRRYIKSAKSITKPNNTDLDWIGIQATRLNGELVRTLFGKFAHPKVTYNPNKKINFKKVLIAAGDVPGSSSDLDAVLLAKTYNCKEVINLTNIDRIYDKDPGKNKNAKPLDKISWRQLLKITGTKWTSGKNLPFDPIASKTAMKNKITLKLLNGKNIKNVKSCLENKPFKGTIVN